LNNTRNVYLLYAIIFLQGFVFYGPVATLFRQARGLSMSDIFIIESISWAVLIVLEVPWGWVSDRFGYKKTLIVVNTIFFISKIIFYKAYSFEWFLIERLLLAIVFSGLSGCDTALIYGSIDSSKAQSIFGRYSAFGTLGFILASMGSTVIVAHSMEYTALFTIFPYAVAAILTFFLVEVKDEHKEKTHIVETIKVAFDDKSIILFIISIALVVEVAQAVTVFLNQVQYSRSGIDPVYFGIIVAFIQCGRLLSVKASSVSRRLGNHRAMGLFIILIVLSCTMLLMTTHPILSITSVAVIAIAISLIGPIELDIKNKNIEGSDRATILSIYSMLGGLLASLGNVLVGKAANESVQLGFLICIGMSLLSYILLRLYAHMAKQRAGISVINKE